jgi:hypothetical protein
VNVGLMSKPSDKYSPIQLYIINRRDIAIGSGQVDEVARYRRAFIDYRAGRMEEVALVLRNDWFNISRVHKRAGELIAGMLDTLAEQLTGEVAWGKHWSARQHFKQTGRPLALQTKG